MQFDSQCSAGVLIVFLTGRVDSTNAAEAESAIRERMEAQPFQRLVLDCTKLEYISSAGLRVILRCKKTTPDTSLVNVSPEVYEILDMTGFTEMMQVQKAYRVLSVEGCEVIGQGANGKVCRIDRDTIVKVYRSADALPEIERERELARTAFVLGIPTAIPYDVVRIEGGAYGSVFELLNAESFVDLLVSGEKSVAEVAQMSVELLRQIHATLVKPGSMPDMRLVALDWADFLKDYLAAEYYEKLHALIAAVPTDLHMLHGDYHIKNVLLQNGEALLIDMDTLCCGHPVFELGSMFNAYRGYSELDHENIRRFLGVSYETAGEFWHETLRQYLETDDEQRVREVEEKAMIVGYTRMMRRRIRRSGFESEEGRAQIESCRSHLEQLLPKVDSLLF